MFKFIKNLFERKTNFTVTSFGKPLDFRYYTWDETTKTFTTEARYLVLDFSNIAGVTFNTGGDCIFKTGSDCIFKTGSDCIFKTGYHCKFETGNNCVFHTGYVCGFNVGKNCSLNDCYNLNSNEIMLLLVNRKLITILDYISAIPYKVYCGITKEQEIYIKVGCQEHSLEFWKENYLEIAKQNGFDGKLISEYLNHLKTIEENLSKTIGNPNSFINLLEAF